MNKAIFTQYGAGIDRPKPSGPGLAVRGSLIWGTCLGFEQMIVSIAQECILKPCQAKDKMSTLIPNWYWPHSEYISGKDKELVLS